MRKSELAEKRGTRQGGAVSKGRKIAREELVKAINKAYADRNSMTAYDAARANVPYWENWKQNPSNRALQQCQHICCPPIHLRDFRFCLDCHGELQEVAAYVYRCKDCHVLHGFSGGNSSAYARFHRCGQLEFSRANIDYDFSGSAVLSSFPPFRRWLARRSGRR
jgi:hypothetical protein